MQSLNHIRSTIIKLKEDDLKFRNQLIADSKLNDGYHPDMEAIHIKNASVLNEIIDEIGYPTIEKVGKQANDAAWLIIQHAISIPEFMKKCKKMLEIEVENGKASPLQMAYLSDRISVFKGQVQLYGTQFDWDENGQLTPNSVDDVSLVNQRRQLLGLNTLEQQTEMMNQIAKSENQTPILDDDKRKSEILNWRKKVGWIK